MRERIQKLITRIREDWHYYRNAMDVEWDDDGVPHATSPYLRPFYFVREVYLSRIVEVTWCRWFGHDIEDGSWAGPDSGGEDMTCRRCGWHFHHIYY